MLHRRSNGSSNKQQQLRAAQDLLADRWTEVLAAEEYELERPSKSYPKRRPLPRSEEEAPTSPAHDMADRPPRGRDRETSPPSTQAMPQRCSTKARENAPDLRDILEDKARQTRSIYGSRGRLTTRDDNHHAEYNKSGQAEHNRHSSSELHRDIAQYRGAAGLKSLRPKSMNSNAPPRVTRSAGRYPDQRRKHLHRQRMTWQTGHLAAATERPLRPPPKPCPNAAQLRHGKMRPTYETYWRIRQDKQDRSTDRVGASLHVTTTIMPNTTNPARPNTTDIALPSCIVI